MCFPTFANKQRIGHTEDARVRHALAGIPVPTRQIFRSISGIYLEMFTLHHKIFPTIR